MIRNCPNPPGDSATASSAELRVVPRKLMIVYNNVICFVILPSLFGASATAKSAEFRGIPVISMIVLKYTVSYLSNPSRRLRNREFRIIRRDSSNFDDSLLVLKYTLFRICPIPQGDSATANSAEFHGIPRTLQ